MKPRMWIGLGNLVNFRAGFLQIPVIDIRPNI